MAVFLRHHDPLQQQIDQAEDNRTQESGQESLHGLIDSLTLTLQTRAPQTWDHCHRVAQLAAELGERPAELLTSSPCWKTSGRADRFSPA